MRHFFLETEPGVVPEVGQTVSLDREESHHLGTVLRGGQQEVVLTDGRGHRFEALVEQQDRRSAQLKILTVEFDEEETLEPRLTLALAMVKPKRFEWAMEKAVELGVHRIVPLISEHVVMSKNQKKDKRSGTIMRTAIKQCGRSFLPQLDDAISVKSFLKDLPQGITFFGAIPEEMGVQAAPVSLMAWGQQQNEPVPQNLTVLIGPEGGWHQSEVSLFCNAGLQAITLGPHILRAETAATAVLGSLQQIRQQMIGQGMQQERS